MLQFWADNLTSKTQAKLGGVDSFGMVLCGAKDEKAVVEILEPPAESEDGERLFCGVEY